MLERVQTGELSPAEAATALLEVRRRDLPPGEPLDSLLARLGPPPPDLQEAWCLQLRSIGGEYERDTGQSLPEIALSDCAITPSGTLAWRDRRYRDSTPPSSTLSPACEVAVREFQGRLAKDQPEFADVEPDFADEATRLPGDDDPMQAAAISIDVGDIEERLNQAAPTDLVTSGIEPSPGQARTQRQWIRPSIRTRVVAACGLIALLGGAAYWAAQARRSSDADANIDTPPARKMDGAMVPVEPHAQWSPEDLETLDSMLEEEIPAESETPSDLIDLTLVPQASLDSSLSAPAEIDPPSATDQLEPDRHEPASSELGKTQDAVRDPLTETQTIAPDALPIAPDALSRQAASTVIAVELPEVSGHEDWVLLSEANLGGPTLDFPFDPPLAIGKAADPFHWQITDARSVSQVAMLRCGSNGTWFKWLSDASESPHANDLVHARILGADGSTIFLRPEIRVAAMPIRVDQADVTATWNLGDPIPQSAARHSLALVVPPSVKIKWIEALDPSSLRRGQAVVTLKSAERDDIALGIRFDTRCSKTLSCRIRYAARMGPSMPWQTVSTTLIKDIANRLTRQSMLISNEATRLSRVYELADSAGRRILRVKQDRNDGLGAQVRLSLERIAALQTLIATLESQARLNLRVWVDWPDRQQDLLITEVAAEGLADEHADRDQN